MINLHFSSFFWLIKSDKKELVSLWDQQIHRWQKSLKELSLSQKHSKKNIGHWSSPVILTPLTWPSSQGFSTWRRRGFIVGWIPVRASSCSSSFNSSTHFGDVTVGSVMIYGFPVAALNPHYWLSSICVPASASRFQSVKSYSVCIPTSVGWSHADFFNVSFAGYPLVSWHS